MVIEKWITSNRASDKAVYFRKVFSVANSKRVILKISALGWFKAFINGKSITDEEFLPGWTDYTKRVLLFSYDITSLIKEKNVISVAVGKGWALGTILFGELKKYYQIPTPCLYARLEFENEKGEICVEEFDGWKFGYGSIIENDIMLGETQDYYQENKEFFQESFDASQWEDVKIFNRRLQVEDKILPRVSVHEIFVGKRLGNGIFDFGQNFSGLVKLKVKCQGHTEIIVRHGEILDEKGNLYVGNLRKAKAVDRYILPIGEYVLRPWFTYHGFRYAEVTINGQAEIISCEGLAIYTNAPAVGSFQTSSALVNQITSNCVWGIKSNIHYVPTDCPQRDERLGWLGDAGIIARSIMYQFDCREMWLHYLSLIAEAVREDGAIPCIAPNAKGFLDNAIGASGWADAFLGILSDYYDFYNDKEVIKKYFPIAEKFIAWLDNHSTNYRRNTYCFSDWLSVNADLVEGYGDVDFTVFDISFYALDCLWMQKFCKILNIDGEKYRIKHERAKRYFLRNLYINGEIIGGGKQTALLLAYKADFLSLEEIETPLLADINANGITSGFIGIKYLFPVLSKLGRFDVAYALITNREFPSWGYTIDCGATTLWERWDSYTKEKGVCPHGMNSFNHFAFGSCLEWFYADVLGIKIGEDEHCLAITPTIDYSGRINSAKGSYKSRFGLISVSWEVEERGAKKIAKVYIDYPIDIQCSCDFKNWVIVDSKLEKGRQRFVLENKFDY